MEERLNIHKLSFATAKILEDDIAEIIVDSDIEINSKMVFEYHDWIKNNLPDPCFVLINKKNSFTYSFNAQIKIGTINQIKAAAFFTPGNASFYVTSMLGEFPRKLNWNYNIFRVRDEALFWLKDQRKPVMKK